MPRKFNLLSKSDMRKFERQLEKDIYKMAEKSLKQSKFEITCPHCSNKIKVHEGNNSCPYCRNTVTVDLKFDK